jgi:quercetin 2,3-dioxygenase
MSVRVVVGEISAKDATVRTAIPNTNLPRWPPFVRVAETIATPRRAFPPHRHEGVEVLTYIIEGSGFYALGPEAPDPVVAGSTKLLTATTSVGHSINPDKGRTVRWFSTVTRLPEGRTDPPRVQSARAAASGLQPDGTVVRRLVGPGTGITSAIGLEVEDLEFHDAGDSYRKVGHDRIAICYALSGRGSVDTESLDVGEAALVEDAAGMAIHGRPGLRVVLVNAPRPR